MLIDARIRNQLRHEGILIQASNQNQKHFYCQVGLQEISCAVHVRGQLNKEVSNYTKYILNLYTRVHIVLNNLQITIKNKQQGF